MKWHSLLRNPNDLPQRINKYDESEDVMVIERVLHNELHEKNEVGLSYAILQFLLWSLGT